MRLTAHYSCVLSKSNICRNISPFGEDARQGEYAKHKFQKNTQAYFGDRRILRTGFVFDEPLRTPTYSTKFHTQAYRSGHNEAVLKNSRFRHSKIAKTLDITRILREQKELLRAGFQDRLVVTASIFLRMKFC